MHLWIDGQCLQTASRVRGIGRYVTDFISALAAGGQIQLSVSFNAAFAEETIIARAQLSPLIGNENIHLWHGIAEGGEASTGYTERRKVSEIALAHHVACLAPDVALCASPFEGLADPAVPLLSLDPHGIPLVGICYDFIPLRFAKQYLTLCTARESYDRRLKALGCMASLLAISEFAASEARVFCPSTPVYPILAGLTEAFTASGRGSVRSQRDRQHLLYVGSLDWRKNAGLIARATALVEPSLRAKIQLDIAGAYRAGDADELRAAWIRAGLRSERLHFLGSPTDQRLAELYLEADMLIQPSLMEGFGLTALEAMACGTPVLAARAGSLPEVVQNDEALFDPVDPEELAQKITRLLREPGWADELRLKGREAARSFSWRNTAIRVLQALEDLPARSARAPDLATIRTTSARSLAALSKPRRLSSESMAQTMALAEPSVMAPPRLLVDVTETVRNGLRTGIQRVVRKTVAHLLDWGEKVVPFYNERTNQVFDAARYLDRAEGASVLTGSTLGIRACDHLLMLDSSWGYREAQGNLIRAAKMASVEVTIVIYDLVPLKAPAFCSDGKPPVYRAWLGMVLEYADNLLCISRAVADDVADLLSEINFDRKIRIGYWPLGADFDSADALNHDLPLQLGMEPFFLTVGTLEPRKGHRAILQAFEQLWLQGVDVTLVLAGKRGWMMDAFVRQLQGHHEFGKRLHWVEAPSDAALSRLYRSARAVIAASFAEGFGLPLIEAAHYGKPVIASDLPVFREVTTGIKSVRFFEPGVSDALADAILAHLADGSAMEVENASDIPSWSESARELAQNLRSRDWYRIHEPKLPGKATSPGPFNSIAMQSALPGADCAIEITRVEGPVEAKHLSERYIFCVKNRSQFVLSGQPNAAGKYAVVFAGRAFDKDGREIRLKLRAQPIPLTVGPGGSIYLAIEINRPGRRAQGGWIEVGLFQNDIGWLGSSAKVPL